MTKNDEPAAAGSDKKTASTNTKSNTGTGKEDWGRGGKYRIDANGKRVRVKDKE